MKNVCSHYMNDFFRTNLEQHIKSINLPENSAVSELEFRLGTYILSGFRPGCSVETFNTLLTHYKEKFPMKEDTLLTISIKSPTGNYRVRISDNTANSSFLRSFCMTDELDYRSNTDNISIILKSRVGTDTDVRSYGVRISSSNETSVTDQSEIDRVVDSLRKRSTGVGGERIGDRVQKHYRYMKRYRFPLTEHLALDFSVVKEKDGFYFRNSQVLEKPEHYEVELDYGGLVLGGTATEAHDLLYPYLEELLSVVSGGYGFNAMPSDELEQVRNQYIKLVFGSGTVYSPHNNYFAGPDISALILEHLVGSTRKEVILYNDYVFSDKADGQRHLMYVNSDGKFFLIAKQWNQLIIKSPNLPVKLDLSNSIFDGELVGGGGGTEWKFLVFDILFKNGEDVRRRDFYDDDDDGNQVVGTRYELFSSLIGNDGLFDRIYYKTFYPYIPEQFIEAINNLKISGLLTDTNQPIRYPTDLMVILKKFTYKLDGLVFQPSKGEQSHYMVLTPEDTYRRWDSVIKWKPYNKLSIDFQVFYHNRVKKVVQGKNTPMNDAENEYVEYELKISDGPRGMIPFSASPVKQSMDVLYGLVAGNTVSTWKNRNTIREGDVVECIYHPENGGYWEPLKVRYDKSKPNGLATAQSTWSLIVVPITMQELSKIPSRPEDMPFAGYWTTKETSAKQLTIDMRTLHNAIKLDVLTSAVHQLFDAGAPHSRSDRSLLDLGVGRAGDLHKWFNLRFVYVLGVDENSAAITDANNTRLANRRARRGEIDTEVDLLVADVLKPLHESIDTYPEYVTSILLEKTGKYKFPLVVSFFSVHYFLSNEYSVRQFLRNVMVNLAKDGLFMCITFDGNRVRQLIQRTTEELKEYNIIKTINEENNISLKGYVKKQRGGRGGGTENVYIWEIVVKGSVDLEGGSYRFGQEIVVKYLSIGDAHSEYLVFITEQSQLMDMFNEHDLALIESTPFETFMKSFSSGHSRQGELTTAVEHLNKSPAEKVFSELNSVYTFRKGSKKYNATLLERLERSRPLRASTTAPAVPTPATVSIALAPAPAPVSVAPIPVPVIAPAAPAVVAPVPAKKATKLIKVRLLKK